MSLVLYVRLPLARPPFPPLNDPRPLPPKLVGTENRFWVLPYLCIGLGGWNGLNAPRPPYVRFC